MSSYGRYRTQTCHHHPRWPEMIVTIVLRVWPNLGHNVQETAFAVGLAGRVPLVRCRSSIPCRGFACRKFLRKKIEDVMEGPTPKL